MTQPVERVSFEITGEESIESAIEVLSNFGKTQKFDRVYIELGAESKREATIDKQSRLPWDDDEGDKSESDESGKIQPQTSHAEVLEELYRLDEESPVTTRRVLENLDLPEGTAFAAMSSLFDRGLVNRTRTKNEDNSYQYEVSEEGRKELERIGVIATHA